MFRKLVFRLFGLTIFIVNFCVFNAAAQSKKSDKIDFDTCESVVSGLASVFVDFHKNAKPDSYLVIIGGAMKGERLSSNSRRIQQAIGYLNSVGEVKTDRIVFGIGTPETEAGYLRFYINGAFYGEIRSPKNAKLCSSDGDVLDFKVK